MDEKQYRILSEKTCERLLIYHRAKVKLSRVLKQISAVRPNKNFRLILDEGGFGLDITIDDSMTYDLIVFMLNMARERLGTANDEAIEELGLTPAPNDV